MTEEDQFIRYADATFQAHSGRDETYAAQNADVHEIRGGTTEGTTPTSDATRADRVHPSRRGQRIEDVSTRCRSVMIGEAMLTADIS